MRQIYTFALGLGVGALVCLGVMNFHIVRAKDGLHLVQKHHAKLAQSYVDVRQFSALDWADNADLTAALIADSKEYMTTQALMKSPRVAETRRLGDRSDPQQQQLR
jgi:hypothetical protein